MASQLEKMYEASFPRSLKKINKNRCKLLLPIKKNGIVKKQFLNETKKKFDDIKKDDQIDQSNDKEILYNQIKTKNKELQTPPTSVNTVDILASREKMLETYRLKIGLLSSEILESPQEKLHNFTELLNLMGDKSSPIYITVQKLTTASLLEIFIDLLPSYNIKLFEKTDTKLKTETYHLQEFERNLLKHYTQFLKKLEKMTSVLKKGVAVTLNKSKFNVGILAINCMTSLLTAKPYFNYSINIAKFLIPFLNNKHRKIRNIMEKSFVQILQNDKRGQLSLTIVRHINHIIKVNKNSVHKEVLSVLLHLQLDFEDVIEKSSNHKKNENKHMKQSLSQKAEEHSFKLKKLKKETLELRSDEYKNNKQKTSKEILSLLFTLYFRILKRPSNNSLLTLCLEGLAKFSPYINTSLYQSITDVLINSLNEQNMNLTDQLVCVNAVFTMLVKQKSTFDVMPIKFNSQLSNIFLNLHLGKNHKEINIINDVLTKLLQCTVINETTVLSFIKRVFIMSLNLPQTSALRNINTIFLIMRKFVSFSTLFNCDSGNVEDCAYLYKSNDFDCSYPDSAHLWEIVALQRHYHTGIKMIAESPKFELNKTTKPILLPRISKILSKETQEEASLGKFNPDVFSKKQFFNRKK